MGGGWFVGWVDKPRKNLALVLVKHPFAKLLDPFSVSRSLVSFFVVGWIVDGDTTGR